MATHSIFRSWHGRLAPLVPAISFATAITTSCVAYPDGEERGVETSELPLTTNAVAGQIAAALQTTIAGNGVLPSIDSIPVNERGRTLREIDDETLWAPALPDDLAAEYRARHLCTARAIQPNDPRSWVEYHFCMTLAHLWLSELSFRYSQPAPLVVDPNRTVDFHRSRVRGHMYGIALHFAALTYGKNGYSPLLAAERDNLYVGSSFRAGDWRVDYLRIPRSPTATLDPWRLRDEAVQDCCDANGRTVLSYMAPTNFLPDANGFFIWPFIIQRADSELVPGDDSTNGYGGTWYSGLAGNVINVKLRLRVEVTTAAAGTGSRMRRAANGALQPYASVIGTNSLGVGTNPDLSENEVLRNWEGAQSRDPAAPVSHSVRPGPYSTGGLAQLARLAYPVGSNAPKLGGNGRFFHDQDGRLQGNNLYSWSIGHFFESYAEDRRDPFYVSYNAQHLAALLGQRGWSVHGTRVDDLGFVNQTAPYAALYQNAWRPDGASLVGAGYGFRRSWGGLSTTTFGDATSCPARTSGTVLFRNASMAPGEYLRFNSSQPSFFGPMIEGAADLQATHVAALTTLALTTRPGQPDSAFADMIVNDASVAISSLAGAMMRPDFDKQYACVASGSSAFKGRITLFNNLNFGHAMLEGRAALPESCGCGCASTGRKLSRGEALRSCNGRYVFTHQTDGNVVLYDVSAAPARVIWHSQTFGRPTTTLVMQSDGNLVLYNGASAVWHPMTYGNPGASLRVQDDGNAVVYSTDGRPLWSAR